MKNHLQRIIQLPPCNQSEEFIQSSVIEWVKRFWKNHGIVITFLVMRIKYVMLELMIMKQLGVFWMFIQIDECLKRIFQTIEVDFRDYSYFND